MGMIKISLPEKFLKKIHNMSLKEQEKKFGVSEIGFCSDIKVGGETYSTITLGFTKGDEDIPCDPLDTTSVYQALNKWRTVIGAITAYTGVSTINYVVHTNFVTFVHYSNDVSLPETSSDCTIVVQEDCDRETHNKCDIAVGLGSMVGVPYRCRMNKLTKEVFDDFLTVKEIIKKMKKLGVYVYPDKYI